jgi:hypothetical protein
MCAKVQHGPQITTWWWAKYPPFGGPPSLRGPVDAPGVAWITEGLRTFIATVDLDPETVP